MRINASAPPVVEADMHAIRETTVTPYATPRTPAIIVDEDFTGLTTRARRALMLVLAPIAAVAVAIPFALLTPLPSTIFSILLALATFAAVAGIALALQTSIQLSRIGPVVRPGGFVMSVASIPLGVVTAAIGGLLGTLVSLVQMTRGRQLRSLGRVELPPVESGSEWLSPEHAANDAKADAGAAELSNVADAWRENGRTEHASVAAFAKLSMELVALGAPPSLIEAAHKDALDEMRHTELCFSLARDLDGHASGPGAFPAARSRSFPFAPKSVRLAHLAVESLIDGALNEGISVRVVAELSREKTDPRVKVVLEAIARDEGRHAAHGFAVVRWCVEEGGYPVRAALFGALAALPERLGKGLSPDAADGRWEHLGIPGELGKRAHSRPSAPASPRACAECSPQTNSRDKRSFFSDLPRTASASTSAHVAPCRSSVWRPIEGNEVVPWATRAALW